MKNKKILGNGQLINEDILNNRFLNNDTEFFDDCRFCNIYNTNKVKPVSDVILYENKYFFIIPALGCLVTNYIMIISKRHINSMCYLNNAERNELITLLNEIRAMMKEKYGYYPIVFEHGASNEDVNKSACCVLHAHLHIVPYKLSNQSEMISSLNLSRLNDIDVFFSEGYNKPYIFFMDNEGEIYHKSCVNDSDIFPSQIIRKWIASDIGKSQLWDWRYNSFQENIEITVAELKPLIKKSIKAGDYRLKYIYYCRAMDGLDANDIEVEYDYVQKKLFEQGRVLVNPFGKIEHQSLKLNKINAELIVTENLKGISMADCVIVNLSKKNHLYVGCIAEMIYAKEKGCYVIVIAGDTGVENHFYTLFHADKIYYSLDELLNSEDWRNK